ncbi:hypothetical protein ILYODFUR_017681 [Ilyodon furcidens]|uniref:Uncharacterized protein n=1 Tax=Ilyodon furcidens TaxID=33524 RepID=A0ABV0SMQ2_9TELE
MSVRAGQFEFLVTKIDCVNCLCESLLVCVQHQTSDQTSFMQTHNFRGVLFLDPIRRCQIQKLNTIYSVSGLSSYSLCFCLMLILLLHYTLVVFFSFLFP